MNTVQAQKLAIGICVLVIAYVIISDMKRKNKIQEQELNHSPKIYFNDKEGFHNVDENQNSSGHYLNNTTNNNYPETKKLNRVKNRDKELDRYIDNYIRENYPDLKKK